MILRAANGRLTAILAASGITPYRDLQWERVDAFMFREVWSIEMRRCQVRPDRRDAAIFDQDVAAWEIPSRGVLIVFSRRGLWPRVEHNMQNCQRPQTDE
jgi:hypothetical protein